MIGMRALHDPPTEWPGGAFIRQRITGGAPDVEGLLRQLSARIAASTELESLPQGARVGVAVGSRGLPNLAQIVKTTVDALKARGLDPVVVPAMGSHGAATASGQREVLAEYGVTPESMGVPVEADMATEVVGHDSAGHPVHFSSFVLRQLAAVIPINRVKLHTDFRGPVESGLCKMLVIGLGKREGAEATHALGMAAFTTAIPERARMIGAAIAVPIGVAVVEDTRKEIARVEMVSGQTLVEDESVLLEEATRLMARLPFDAADLLIIEQMGKDIAGPGCDPNVFGRYLTPGMSGGPSIKRIGCLRLTEKTRGNAVGIGQIDVITKALFDEIDFLPTYTNLITSGGLEYAAVPMVADTDRDLVLIGIAGTYVPLEVAKIAVVRTTAHLETMWVSDSLLADMQDAAIDVLSERSLEFDADGALLTRPSLVGKSSPASAELH